MWRGNCITINNVAGFRGAKPGYIPPFEFQTSLGTIYPMIDSIGYSGSIWNYKCDAGLNMEFTSGGDFDTRQTRLIHVVMG